MDGEAVFIFKCGTSAQAYKVADWLYGEDWPDDLRAQLEAVFGPIEDADEIVLVAEPKGARLGVWATNPSSLGVVAIILHYAMQRWRNVPSPQGFAFGIAQQPTIDKETQEDLDAGRFDGGAVLLRREAEMEIMIGSLWLEERLRGAKGRVTPIH